MAGARRRSPARPVVRAARARPQPAAPRRHRRRARASRSGPIRATVSARDGQHAAAARQLRPVRDRRDHEPCLATAAASHRGRRARAVRAEARERQHRDVHAALRLHAERAGDGRALSRSRRLRGAHRGVARHRAARRHVRLSRRDGQPDGPRRAATSTGARRCGTRWRTCSRSRRRTTSCRAGSAKACRCTRSGARVPRPASGHSAAGVRGHSRGQVPAGGRARSRLHPPDYEAQVIVSYMQAGLICEYIGAALRVRKPLERMLIAFRGGKDTAAGDSQARSTSRRRQFDESFAAYVEGELGAVVAGLEALARAIRPSSREAGSKRRIGGASSRKPPRRSRSSRTTSTRQPVRRQGASASRARRDGAADRRRCSSTARGGYDPDALRSSRARSASRIATTTRSKCSKTSLMVAPLRSGVHRRLGDRLWPRTGRARRSSNIRRLLAMNPQDLADAHYRACEELMWRSRTSQGPRTFTVCSGNRPALPGSPTAAFGGRTLSDTNNKLDTRRDASVDREFPNVLRADPHRSSQDHRRPGRSRRAPADDAARRRPLPDHGHAGHREDAARAHARERARASRSSAFSSRPT